MEGEGRLGGSGIPRGVAWGCHQLAQGAAGFSSDEEVLTLTGLGEGVLGPRCPWLLIMHRNPMGRAVQTLVGRLGLYVLPVARIQVLVWPTYEEAGTSPLSGPAPFVSCCELLQVACLP